MKNYLAVRNNFWPVNSLKNDPKTAQKLLSEHQKNVLVKIRKLFDLDSDFERGLWNFQYLEFFIQISFISR